MSVITPAPNPQQSDSVFKEIEQLQKSFERQENKIKVDTNKEYKRLKKQKAKKEQHEK